MKNRFLRFCVMLLMAGCMTSCFILDAIRGEYFIFRNNTGVHLVLLFDYDTSDGVLTLTEGSYLPIMWNISNNTHIKIGTPYSDSWDKHVKDSLHLYVIRDTISYEYWTSHSVEECLTDDYMEQNLLARMTLSLEDVYPSTDPPKEIVFPPENDSYYNTIYYNNYQ